MAYLLGLSILARLLSDPCYCDKPVVVVMSQNTVTLSPGSGVIMGTHSQGFMVFWLEKKLGVHPCMVWYYIITCYWHFLYMVCCIIYIYIWYGYYLHLVCILALHVIGTITMYEWKWFYLCRY